MQVFGMASEDSSLRNEEESFDYLRDATASNVTQRGQQLNTNNDSISFLLDASVIAGGDANTSVASARNAAAKNNNHNNNSSPTSRLKKQGFFSLNDTSVSQFLSTKPSSPPKEKATQRKLQSNTNTTTYHSAKENTANATAITPASSTTTSNNRLNRFQSRLQQPRASLEGRISPKPFTPTPPSPSITITATASQSRAELSPVRTTTSQQPRTVSASPKPIATTEPPSLASSSKSPIRPQIVTRRQSSTSAKNSGVKIKTIFSPRVPQTPGGFWTINTESKSFVNGLLSPFSPLLHSAKNPTNTNLETIRSFDNKNNGEITSPRHQHDVDQRQEYLQFVSLQPCRKVSVVVRVTAVEDSEEAKRCIFPHYKESRRDDSVFSTPTGKGILGTATPSKSSSSSTPHARDVVVVNPTAFGKHIPSQVTMETAKLVAQVANISSEDWARLYEFHHVMWPNTKKNRQSGSSNNNNDFNTMDSVSRAVVQDLLAEHKSSLLISLGNESSCFKTANNTGSEKSDNIGLWTKIINQCSAMLETKGVVRLTMVEILEPSNGGTTNHDSFRDLLAPSNRQTPKSRIHLKHSDMKGAILEGLVDVEIDSMSDLLEALSKIRRRKRKSSGSAATAVIGTLYYWNDAVAYELKRPSNATVTCVELASTGDSPQHHTLESITHRKSFVSLGQALRQLLLQQATQKTAQSATTNEDYTDAPPVISYRETTLTKVLQRSMESSKIVLIASVSPLSKDYDQTVATLNYLRRLLVKPGNTLASPFQASRLTGVTSNHNTPTTDKRNNRTTNFNRSILSSPEAKENEERLQEALTKENTLVEHLVGDPRQRLAKLFQVGTPISKTNSSSTRHHLYHDDNINSSFLTSLDNSTIGSKEDANSYRGPTEEEESRQVVESPLESSNPQPARRETEIHDSDNDNDSRHSNDDWASITDEASIEQDLLRRAKEKALQNEIQEPLQQDNFGDDDNGEDFQYNQEYSDGNNYVQGDVYDEGNPYGGEENFDHDYEDDVNTNGPNDPEHDVYENEEHFETNEYCAQNEDIGDDPELDDELPEQSYYEDAEDEDYDEHYLTPEQTDEDDGFFEEDDMCGLAESSASESESATHYSDKELAKGDDYSASLGADEDYDNATLDLEPLPNEEDCESQEEQETVEELNDDNSRLHSEGAEDTIPAAGVSSSFLDLDPEHADDSTDPGMNQTDYDLPDEHSADDSRHVITRSYQQASQPPQPMTPVAPYQDRAALNSFASPYSVTLKTTQSKEYLEITSERDGLRDMVESLQEDLRTVSVDRDSRVEQYEEKLEEFHEKLVEATTARKEIEDASNKEAMARQEEMERIATEREDFKHKVETLEKELAQISENHDYRLKLHEEEIGNFRAKMEEESERQRVLEEMADEAVSAHKTQIEQTIILVAEREELEAKIEMMERTMKSVERDQGDHATKYQQEIRHLHAKLEETTKEKRAIQKAADDARFELENKSEKIRAMERERETFQSTLISLKSSAKKAAADNSDYLRRFKEDIQQLRDEVDHAVQEKLEVEKTADEIRFAKDDLEQKVKNLEEELIASRTKNSRLEEIREEEQETMRKMSAELRRKDDSEKVDVEHYQREIQRLKRHSNHLESLVAHRQVEFSTALEQLEDDLSEEKRKNQRLEEELSNIRLELSTCLDRTRELEEDLMFANESNSKLTGELDGKNEILKRLQSSYDNLQSLRVNDQEVIAKLSEDLRKRESEVLNVDQLHQKMSRLQHDRDRLQDLMESRRNDYEACIEERETKISTYVGKMEELERYLEEARNGEKKSNNDAKAQIKSLRETSEMKLRQRDAKIDQLEKEVETRKEEIASLRRKENKVSHSERQARHLKDKLCALEAALEKEKKEKEETLDRLRNESHSKKSILEDLESYKKDARQYKLAFQDLNEKLEERQQDDSRVDDLISKFESSLESLKEEAEERTGVFSNRKRDTSSVLQDRGNLEDRGVGKRNFNDDQTKDRMQREGDDEIFMTPRSNRGSRQRDLRTTSRSSILPMASVTTRESPRMLEGQPGVQVTKYHLGTTGEDRAEDIAICVALSAKRGMADESSKELSQLRSQVYRLEDERSEQVFALKSRVRDLQRELSYERAVNGTPVMGSRSGTRRSSYTRDSSYLAAGDEEKYGF